MHAGTNTRSSTVEKVDWYVVTDQIDDREVEFRWRVYHTDGRLLREGGRRLLLELNASRYIETTDVKEEIETFGLRNLILCGTLCLNETIVSYNSALLTAPRFLSLRKDPIDFSAVSIDDDTHLLKIESDVYHHGVEVFHPDIELKCSDNFFDLMPREPKVIKINSSGCRDLGDLQVRSLVHSSGG